jgi:hypothetical protein
MKPKIIPGLFILGALVFLILNVRVVHAETSNAAPRTSSYEIAWYTIDGGGFLGGAVGLLGFFLPLIVKTP